MRADRSHLLLRHPAVLERVNKEIRSVLGENLDLTRAHIRKMPYLKCVLDESKYILP